MLGYYANMKGIVLIHYIDSVNCKPFQNGLPFAVPPPQPIHNIQLIKKKLKLVYDMFSYSFVPSPTTPQFHHLSKQKIK